MGTGKSKQEGEASKSEEDIKKSSRFSKNLKTPKLEMSLKLSQSEPSQLTDSDRWELDPTLLTIDCKIGNGLYGNVYKGKYQGIGPVAIKELRNVDELKDFFDTTTTWKTIDHPRCVKLYGVCSRKRPWYIVSELMDKGKLITCLVDGPDKPNVVQMVHIAVQICEVMRYLELKKMIHLRLTASNIFVSRNWNVKLYAAWLIKQTTNGFYIFDDCNNKMPYKWWADLSKVSRDGGITIKANVLSFGLLLVDIMTHGRRPNVMSIRAQEDEIEHIMTKPEYIPEEFYNIMKACFRKTPHDRPFFVEIYDWLNQLETNMTYNPVDVMVYNEAYHRALEQGQDVNRRIPIMIVGQDRSGKTSLKKHLQGLSFDEEEPSTCGIEVDIVELTEKTAKEPWKKKQLNQFIMNEEEVNERILMETAHMITEKRNVPDDSPGEASANTSLDETQAEPVTADEGAAAANNDDVEAPTVPSLPKDMLDDIKSAVEMAHPTSPPITTFLHDLAGQNVYYDTHYYFLKLQCPYVVVHDLCIPFENIAQPRFKPKLTKERQLNNPSLATNLDHFMSWLTVLNRLREAICLRTGVEFAEFQLPPVLIALTNSDRFDGDIDDVKGRIKERLTQQGFDNVYTTPYVIENSSSCEDEIASLRYKLYELCSTILQQQSPVPIRWLKFEARLSDIMVSKKLAYIPVDEAHEIAKACKVEDADAAIRFLHHQGVLVHHSGSSVVVLNPAWLMNRFTNIITIHQDDDKPCHADNRRLMQTKGILSQDYLRKQEDWEILEELMCRFGLICPWEHEGHPAYIVPSVAPIMQCGDNIKEKLRTSSLAPLFLRFKQGHILPGVFTRFLVQMITKCRDYLRINNPRLCCNYTLLSLEWERQNFDVYLIEQLAAIKVCVLPRTDSLMSDDVCVKFVCFLQNVVAECIQHIKEDEGLFYRNIDVSAAFKCSVCYGETVPCSRHSEHACDSDDCAHFWTIEELRQLLANRKPMVCVYPTVDGTQEFPLKLVKPWLGLEDEEPEVLCTCDLSINDLDVLKRQEICRLLDVDCFKGDFRELAGHFEMCNDDVKLIKQNPEPTDAVLSWAARKSCNTLAKLREVFGKMERCDCLEIIGECLVHNSSGRNG